jgi:hypothetical protein
MAAVVLMVLYNVVLGPAIVTYINGYWPSLEYQNLPAAHLLTHRPRAGAGIVRTHRLPGPAARLARQMSNPSLQVCGPR